MSKRALVTRPTLRTINSIVAPACPEQTEMGLSPTPGTQSCTNCPGWQLGMPVPLIVNWKSKLSEAIGMIERITALDGMYGVVSSFAVMLFL
jgi:hypothetical protein